MNDDPDPRPGESADAAPGDEGPAPGKLAHGLGGYALGLFLAVVLTAASFAMLSGRLVWPPAIPAALVALAVAQIGVHLVFFLHITTGPDNTNNVLALAFGVLIVGLVVFGSVWIMAHLAARMMPMAGMM